MKCFIINVFFSKLRNRTIQKKCILYTCFISYHYVPTYRFTCVHFFNIALHFEVIIYTTSVKPSFYLLSS